MTDREKAIVEAYTGIVMLTGEKLNIFYKYVADLMGRPVYTHELPALAEEIKKRSRDDFIALCREEEPEIDMIDGLKAFIKTEEQKENRTLGDWTKQWILESIIDGKCKITGSATDHSKKKMYVEFSFYQEEQNGNSNLDNSDL